MGWWPNESHDIHWQLLTQVSDLSACDRRALAYRGVDDNGELGFDSDCLPPPDRPPIKCISDGGSQWNAICFWGPLGKGSYKFMSRGPIVQIFGAVFWMGGEGPNFPKCILDGGGTYGESR